ncbi:MAG: SIMPL domain-containing protein [SAR202 cluster bacterium]|nr:SIMPL domain-containing protein [SAR202 cluster bacterium]
MSKFIILFILILSSLIAISCDSASDKGVYDKTPKMRAASAEKGSVYGKGGIIVTGSSSIELKPDMATISLGVESYATTVSVARDNASISINEMLDVMEKVGIDDEDIQTTAFNIYPQYEYIEVREDGRVRGVQELVGFTVSNMLLVTVKNLDDIGEIIDKITDAGGNDVRFNSINFGIQDPVPYQSQLRKLAVEDGITKASQLAEYSGVKLGSITMINDYSSQASVAQDQAVFAERAMAIPSTSINPGSLNLSMQVDMIFEIEN